MEQKFNVFGMTCSACTNAIEKSLRKIEGIKVAKVNLISNTLLVSFDETKVSTNQIINTVNSLGYTANEYNENINSQQTKKENKASIKKLSLKTRFILSLIFLIPLMIFSMGHMLGLPLPKFCNPHYNAANFVLIQLILTTPILIINFQFFVNGTLAVKNMSPNMDTLVMLGSLAAYLYSIVLFFIVNFQCASGNLELAAKTSMSLFFESAAMILTLVTLGKWLEEKSKGKTKDEINKLLKLQPSNALIEVNGSEKLIEIKDIKIGDIVIIKPGDYVPCDGTIIEGTSSLNKSAITGESIPLEVNVNDYITSASINLTGYIKIKAEKIGSDTMLEKIIQLMENAGNNKAPLAKIADRVSAIFVPTVVIISILTLIVWLIISKDFGYSLNLAISVLVISCPCALGLATPMAIMVGTGVGSANGILYKDAISLEKLSKVKNVVMDKTGTITEGNLSVTEIIPNNISEKELIKIAVSLEKISSHPLSECIVNYGKNNNIKILPVTDYKYVMGKGIVGSVGNNNYALGNAKLLADYNIQIVNSLNLSAAAPIYLGNTETKQFLGAIIVEDKIKQESKIAINNLNKKFINTFMLSGDNKITAESVAEQVDIKNVYSEVMPEDKLNIISNLQISNLTAFVGDGINDAPALKQADIGIAIGNGTDVAIEAADVVLVNNSLLDVDTAINLSRATVTNIKENLFWAFFYNTVGIPIAAGVLVPVGVMLNPMLAALAMSLSSLFVVGNALRLRLFKNKNKDTKKNNQNKLTQNSIVEIVSENKNNITPKINNIKNNNENQNDIIKNDSEQQNLINKENNMTTIIIDGLSCNHCKTRVENALNKLDGVNAIVNLEKGCAVMKNTKNISDEKIRETITNAGYEVKEIKKN